MVSDALAPNELERALYRMDAKLEEAHLIIDEMRSNMGDYKEKISSVILSDFATALYGDDFESLKRDVSKIVLVGDSPYKATKNERFNLLRALFSGLRRYCGDDISFLMNECQRKLDAHEEVKDEDDDLPFV